MGAAVGFTVPSSARPFAAPLIVAALVAASGMILPIAGAGIAPDAAPLDVGFLAGFASCTASPSPDTACAPALSSFAQWTQEAPLGEIERVLAARTKDLATSAPSPPLLPGYGDLPPEAQRVLWREWVLRVAWDATHPGAPGPGFAFPTEQPEGDEAATPLFDPPDAPTPQRLRPLWAREAHGVPLEVLPADHEGGTFLITTQGALRFAAPDAAPAWFVSAGGYFVRKAAVADANGDGELDLVLGISAPFWARDEVPSIVVVDGGTGVVLFSGLYGTESLWSWTTTDANDDGSLDLLGVDFQGRLVAARLDGTRIFAEELPQLPDLGELGLSYLPVNAILYADVDGDGVKDAVVPNGYLQRFSTFALLAVVIESTRLGIVSAHRGTDAGLLWAVPESDGAQRTLVPVGAGDLNGDDREDPVFDASNAIVVLAFALAGGVLAGLYSEGVVALDGATGATLVRDVGRGAFAFPFTILPLPDVDEFVPLADYVPLTVLDLNRDGTAEIVGLRPEGAGRFDVVGRDAPAAPGGPSSLAYERKLDLPEYDAFGVRTRLRDLNGDEHPDLVLLVTGVDFEDDGALSLYDTRAYRVAGDAAALVSPPGPMGLYDYDPLNRQGYSWSLLNDRWGPVDDQGAPVGNGTGLLPSLSTWKTGDANDDGVPDLLVKHGISFAWLDGRTGETLIELSRPVGRFAEAVETEGGRLRLLENEWGTDAYVVSDLAAGRDQARIDPFAGEGPANGFSFLDGFADFNKDGRLDIALQFFDFENDVDELRLYDARTEEAFWSLDGENGFAFTADVLPERPGHEILYRHVEDETDELSLLLPELGTPRWTYDVGEEGGFVADAREGLLLFRTTEKVDKDEVAVVKILSGRTGAENAKYRFDKDTSLRGSALVNVTRSPFSEAVITYEVSPDDGEAKGDPTYQVLVWDWSAKGASTRFELTGPVEKEIGGFEIRLRYPFYEDAVGDWNADGVTDLAFLEQGEVVVRSGATGGVLAAAPEMGFLSETPDLNGDGALELGVASAGGRLRLYAFDAQAGTLSRDRPVRVVADPTRPVVDAFADSFFGGADEKGFLPAPGAGLLVAALAVLALGLVARRGRRS